ncbi:MAG: Na(+)-translocating NADH-quinone reductase subunit A [Halioglobus sp.]|nr:Na(+)-translocating NADH-quinone reductase subunit A [Halioglobus sp.]
MIKIKRGLDIPIQGAPRQVIEDAPAARAVALVGFDYIGMKPTMAVREGERVKCGQVLFTDKKTEGVCYTAPAAGTISAINRGARRVLQSVVIEVDGEDSETFDTCTADALPEPSAIREQLVRSGQWTAIRTRPYSKVPAPESEAAAIFVTAVDSQPLAADPTVVISQQSQAFSLGQDILATLTTGKVYLCTAGGAEVPSGNASNIEHAQFAGPHPAGLVGTHVHFLEGVSATKVVWTIGYQDVIAIGRLFLDGRLYTDRVIALAGPQVEQPRLLRTRVGADLQALCAGQIKNGDNRVISGSVLGGRAVQGATAYLGRYHTQVSVLLEGRQREFMGWISPGFNKHSNLGIYFTSIFGTKPLAMTTNTNGSERAMVPVGSYEKVVPMDMLPTQLLRALIVGDTEMAQALGCLELEEEDLALCSYVCPGKYEYGPILRETLTRIEKEG